MNIFPIGAKTPSALIRVMNYGIWKLNTPDTIFLTFDDGPTPDVTEFVLNELKKYHAPATFFCIGKNVKQHPEIFKKLIEENHAIGNHTMSHVNGWKTTAEMYLQEVEECENLITQFKTSSSNLFFRPPYGRITPSQFREVNKTYHIIFWDVLSYDFHQSVSGEDVANVVVKHAKAGSIVVFHDSDKAFPRLKIALPKVLKYFSEKGFRFDKLSNQYLH